MQKHHLEKCGGEKEKVPKYLIPPVVRNVGEPCSRVGFGHRKIEVSLKRVDWS